MKKILCLWAVVGCFLFCGLCVRADVIWEPEDSFYKKHSEECVYVNRLYTANGPDGEVILYKSPEMPAFIIAKHCLSCNSSIPCSKTITSVISSQSVPLPCKIDRKSVV